jgi:proteasome lid subunit RPN8/RPN11
MKKPPSLIFCLLLVLAFSLSLAADGLNLSNSSDISIWSTLAVNAKGEVMVVWTEWNTPGQIFYRIKRNGQWSEMINSRLGAAKAWSNQMVVDSKGIFHLTFADGYGSSSREIFYSAYSNSSWSTPEMVFYSPYNSAWNRMAVDVNDDVHVVWYHSHVPKGAPLSSDVVTMSKSSQGTWPSRYLNISGSAGVETIHPAIAAKDGNIYSIYMEDVSPRKIYFRERVNGTWKSPQHIERSGYYPDMILDDAGNIHSVLSKWTGKYYYKSRINGVWNEAEVISDDICPLQFGDIHYNNGRLVATWIQGVDEKWAVYAATKMTGDEWSAPIKIADTPGGSDGNKHVQVFVDDRDCAHFSWEGIGIGGEHDIYYAKHAFSGVEKDDLVGSWDGQGVFMQDSETGRWTREARAADSVACGDLDGDGTDDLIGVWGDQGGVWVKYSSTATWSRLSTSADDITAGDMNGDGLQDLVGTWNGQGVFFRDSQTGRWVKLSLSADVIAAGDFDGDGTDDLAGIWSAQQGGWVKLSSTGEWMYYPIIARDLAVGDMNGDGRDDLLGTIDGDGVYYIDSVNYAAVKLARASEVVAAGDMDGDGTDDLIGVWADQGGVWAKYSSSGSWCYIASVASGLDTGNLIGGTAAAGMEKLLNSAVSTTGSSEIFPGEQDSYLDLSGYGPGGSLFTFIDQADLLPVDSLEKIPGPGDPGFRFIPQKNLVPRENAQRKRGKHK